MSTCWYILTILISSEESAWNPNIDYFYRYLAKKQNSSSESEANIFSKKYNGAPCFSTKFLLNLVILFYAMHLISVAPSTWCKGTMYEFSKSTVSLVILAKFWLNLRLPIRVMIFWKTKINKRNLNSAFLTVYSLNLFI